MSVGIVIPTKNKSDFIVLQFQYYTKVKSKHTLYIGDSSNKYHSETIKNAIKKYRDHINIEYYYFPDMSAPHVHKKIVNIVKEDFIVYAGDDDFYVPETLSKCSEFLKNNDDYNSAHAQAVVISVSKVSSSDSLLVESAGPYSLLNNECLTAHLRLKSFLDSYWLCMFSVQRTKSCRIAVDKFDCLIDESFTEIINGCISSILGKSKTLEDLYLVRMIHPKRNILPSPLDWIMSPNWYPSFKIFKETLSSALQAKDNMCLERARDIVQEIFNKYLMCSFVRFENNRTDVLKEITLFVKRLVRGSFSKRLYFYCLNRNPIKTKAIRLQTLLHKDNVYYQQFRVVYDVITSK